MPDTGHTPRSRDAALRRLARANRWLIAGSVTLTGVLTAVAANAFPGKTLKATGGGHVGAAQRAAPPGSAPRATATGSSHGSVQPPAQAPQSHQNGPLQKRRPPRNPRPPAKRPPPRPPRKRRRKRRRRNRRPRKPPPSQEASPSQEAVPSPGSHALPGTGSGARAGKRPCRLRRIVRVPAPCAATHTPSPRHPHPRAGDRALGGARHERRAACR